MNVLVVGGCGYIGAMLSGWLLVDGHKVTVIDTQWFGSGSLSDNENMTFVKRDVREVSDGGQGAVICQDAVIYLAGITNNDMCEQNRSLHYDVNMIAFASLVEAAEMFGVQRFILASSVAAYGSSLEDATEETPLRPTTLYGKAKDFCEGFLLSRKSDMEVVITRSASVCGHSVNQRFDTTVNRMVHSAVRHGYVQVNGGDQKRSHIHIQDICRAYRMLLTAPSEIVRDQVFNFVDENQTVMETGEMVARECGVELRVGPATDDRSYSVDGTKAETVLGFKPENDLAKEVRLMNLMLKGDYWKDSETNPKYMRLAHGLA